VDVNGASVVVTGGASGLGAASARRLAGKGAHVVILDLAESDGKAVADELRGSFAPSDVTDADSVQAAIESATAAGPLRALVHCAGRGGTVRLVERDGTAGSLEAYEAIIRVNLVGTFNVLRLAAAAMATNEPVDGERGVCVLTSSVAAWEGQVGQIPYASAKAGIVGMTLVAARDLATKRIRVNTIAPGVFDTPILSRFSDEVRDGLAQQVPNPSRLGQPDEFAALAAHIVENAYLNGETIRLDGAIRMGAR
jgi:NAD(P)-dependent dehydrogenase (short-subunit alcohol dehydrogenase family)